MNYEDPSIDAGRGLNNAEIVNKDSFERLRSKNRRKELLRRIFYFILAILLLIAIGFLCIVLFFGLKTIEVEGNSRYTKEELVTASGLDSTNNLFDLDLEAAQEAVRKACPYVSSVSFERVLPSTLIMTVVEDAPSYYAEIFGNWFLLSEDLRVISRHDIREEIEIMGLPLLYVRLPEVQSAITGEPLQFTKAANYKYIYDFLTALRAEEIFASLDAVDASDRYHMDLYAGDGRYLIQLGTSESLTVKLHFVAGVLKDKTFDEFTIASINVEYVKQAIVKKQENRFDIDQK
ncbi:MAG: FtsQ-type POTRA domain-containing protein [Ruminococcaceae bacterium]|nr:FtsQ-type POTRA domain-containing protein [Oscillospiraceae bacterium]